MEEQEYTDFLYLPPSLYDFIENDVAYLYSKCDIHTYPIDPFEIARKLGYVLRPFCQMPIEARKILLFKFTDGISYLNNIYMGRWLGRTWQNYGLSVIPTVGWALPDTYDMCLSAIEKNTPVVISTLGCFEHKEVFMRGFDEMKARIEPPVIIVFGGMIPGMTGTFLNFRYSDSFSTDYQQLKIEGIPSLFTIKEAV